MERLKPWAVEPEWEPKNFEWWSRSLKFEFPFNRHSLWNKPMVQIIQWFLVSNGPNRFGIGAKNFRCLELEPEPKILVPAPQPWLTLTLTFSGRNPHNFPGFVVL